MKHRIITSALTLMLAFVAAFAASKAEWTVSIDSLSPTEGAIVWQAQIEKDWHIYGMERPANLDVDIVTTSFIVDANGADLVGEIVPSEPAKTHFDGNLGAEIPSWEGTVSFRQAFKLSEGSKGAAFSGVYKYMVCDATQCTRPMEVDYSLTFGEAPAPATATEAPAAVAAVSASEQPLWEPVEEVYTEESNNSWLSIFLIGFVGGLLALLTPCVWPMIPMTVSFFLKSTKDRRKSVMNACLYGLSIVVIFLVLGIAITMIFGAGKLNELATSAVFNIVLFVLLVVFAISFLGAFEIKLPDKWSAYIDEKAETTTGFISIFFMALTLVLVSFSCTGPIIGTLLVEAASQGNIVGPAFGMGGFALGLALPFALFAIFPSYLSVMPKSGGWLNSVKVVLGFIELILSLKFLSVADLAYGWRILDREVFVALWIVLFALLGMYLLGKLRFAHDGEQSNTSILGFFLATISFSFAVYLLPGLWGAPLKAISAFAPPIQTQDFNLYGGEYHEFSDYDEGMAYAAREGKPVIIDFTGYGCVNCRKMEMAVFDMPQVRDKIEKDYVLIKLYVDAREPLANPYQVEDDGKTITLKTVGDKWSYLQEHKFRTASQPYYVLLDNAGRLLEKPRVYDEDVQAFSDWLNAGHKAYVEQQAR